MTNFMDVILEASKRRYEHEAHYQHVRAVRWHELKELADECDILLDGRRKQNKQKKLRAQGA